MASSNLASMVAQDDVIGRAITRLFDLADGGDWSGGIRPDAASDDGSFRVLRDNPGENAADFMAYLVANGITDEDELVEFVGLASGKRYDPQDGSFS